MSITAPGAYVTPASPVVLQQMARLNEHADDLLVQVDQAINALQSVTIPTADLEPGWTDEELQSILNQLGPLPGYENTDWLEGLDLSSGSENFVFNPLVFQRLQEQLPEIIIPAPSAAPSLPLAPADWSGLNRRPGGTPRWNGADRPLSTVPGCRATARALGRLRASSMAKLRISMFNAALLAR